MLPRAFCPYCQYLEGKLSNNQPFCKAFPGGISSEILYASKLHDKILPDQNGSYIFTPKEGYEDYIPKVYIPEGKIKLPPLSEMLKKLRERGCLILK